MMADEKELLEQQMKSFMEEANAKKDEAKTSVKTKKPYEWTEKRKEAFDKMRSGLAMKVEVTKQMKKEKRESEKKDIKERIQKIMSTGNKKQKAAPMESESEDGEASDSASSDSDKGEHCHRKRETPKKESRAHTHQMPPQSSKSSSKHNKRRSEQMVQMTQPSSESDSESEEESFEVASNKQKQHYRDAKVNIGKAQRSTRTLQALDNYILL